MESNILTFGTIKLYNDGDCRLLVYKNARVKSNTLSFQINDNISSSNYDVEQDKMKRVYEIRRKIFDYAKQNDFDYFGTFTFSPVFDDNEKRFDEMMRFLRMMRFRAKRADVEFRYLVVPELHKSGLIHFHGLFGGYKLNLVDSGHKFRNTKIYNVSDFSAGFTNFQFIRSKDKVSNYISKYITKNLLDSPVAKGKKKYWCTKNLKLPIEKRLEKEINLEYTPSFESEICSIYNLSCEQFEKIMGQL